MPPKISKICRYCFFFNQEDLFPSGPSTKDFPIDSDRIPDNFHHDEGKFDPLESNAM